MRERERELGLLPAALDRESGEFLQGLIIPWVVGKL
jgi:hypothetical protein